MALLCTVSLLDVILTCKSSLNTLCVGLKAFSWFKYKLSTMKYKIISSRFCSQVYFILPIYSGKNTKVEFLKKSQSGNNLLPTVKNQHPGLFQKKKATQLIACPTHLLELPNNVPLLSKNGTLSVFIVPICKNLKFTSAPFNITCISIIPVNPIYFLVQCGFIYLLINSNLICERVSRQNCY